MSLQRRVVTQQARGCPVAHAIRPALLGADGKGGGGLRTGRGGGAAEPVVQHDLGVGGLRFGGGEVLVP